MHWEWYMVYGMWFCVWKCDSMRWNSSEASYWLPTLNPPCGRLSRRDTLSSPLHPLSLWLSQTPFSLCYSSGHIFSFAFIPGVVVWAASDLPCTCVVNGLPGSYWRGLTPQVCASRCQEQKRDYCDPIISWRVKCPLTLVSYFLLQRQELLLHWNNK
jgi:hypothetical protein